MRKWFVGLVLVASLSTLVGCEDSSAPAGGNGPAVAQPPGAPESGPEAGKTGKLEKPKP